MASPLAIDLGTTTNQTNIFGPCPLKGYIRRQLFLNLDNCQIFARDQCPKHPITNSMSLIPCEKSDRSKWTACLDDTLSPRKYNPFLSFAFLDALERSGCASEETGWLPHHLVLKDADETILAATECLEEYYLDTTLCKSCFKNCLKCENEEKCEECKEGYELNSDLTSCSQISNLETECLDKIEGCIMC